MRLLQVLCFSALVVGAANAAVLTGTYDISGDPNNHATGPANGPFDLTATSAGVYSYVDFIPNQSVNFGDLTSLFANFESLAGGSGGGTPRLSVGLFDGTTERFLEIYFGNSPSFTDSDAGLNAWSGVNLIGNEDAGRYDTSHFGGGSPFTNYTGAKALVGSYQVEDVYFIVDTYGADRHERLDGIGGSFTPTPEPFTMSLGLAGVGLFIRRRNKAKQA